MNPKTIAKIIFLILLVSTTSQAFEWTAENIKIEAGYDGESTEITADIKADIEWTKDVKITATCFNNRNSMTAKTTKSYKLSKNNNSPTFVMRTNRNNCTKAQITSIY